MAPGQQPYTPEEWTTVNRLVADAAHIQEELTPEEVLELEREVEKRSCKCSTGRVEDCPQHGIAASNARQNRYWQRVGGHD